MKPTKLIIPINLKALYTVVFRLIARLLSLSTVPLPPTFASFFRSYWIGLPKIQEIMANAKNRTANITQKMNEQLMLESYHHPIKKTILVNVL